MDRALEGIGRALERIGMIVISRGRRGKCRMETVLRKDMEVYMNGSVV